MTKRIFHLYYPPLMLFLVYTFADRLLREIICSFSLEMLLYIILWLSLTVQTTFAYIRIRKTPLKHYSMKALISDSIDVIIAVYVCAAMGSIGRDINNCQFAYLHISLPFIILSINQFWWFVIVKNFDIPAIFRICILFWGMIGLSISELMCHSIGNLVGIVALITILGILRAINKAPNWFEKVASQLWSFVKNKRKLDTNSNQKDSQNTESHP